MTSWDESEVTYDELRIVVNHLASRVQGIEMDWGDDPCSDLGTEAAYAFLDLKTCEECAPVLAKVTASGAARRRAARG